MNAFTGRDRRALRIDARPGRDSPVAPKHAIVVGGGIAGLAAACGLVERGVTVTLIEPESELGGRVRAWKTQSPAGETTMSRGFHAFFRQYYNLRALLTRAGALDDLLRPIEDYPVVSSSGDRDSFSRIPRTPPWNFISFVWQSPTFTMRDLAQVDVDLALSMLDVDFPQTYRAMDGQDASGFLDRLRFPKRARHLALEVFARSFFADPREFSAGELLAMFHSYFLGSAEGLLFDVPRDDFDTTLWAPLGAALERSGMQRVAGSVRSVTRTDDADVTAGDASWTVQLADGSALSADAVVLAAGPQPVRDIVAASPDLTGDEWRARLAEERLAPAFAVLRYWFDGKVNTDRAPFLGTAGFGPLDNVTVLERFEAGAATWSEANSGSVIELHAYALPDDLDPRADSTGTTDLPRTWDPAIETRLVETLRDELARVYPETRDLNVVAQELLIEQDCPLIGPGAWDDRPTVTTPTPGVVLAGDWVRCDLPIALMERAATTGWMAANELLAAWGVAGHTLWSVPPRARQSWPGKLRALLRRVRPQKSR